MTPYSLSEAVWFAACTPSEKLVLLCIAWHAKPGGGGAYPGVRRLAKLTGLARSTTENALASLIGRGYVSITKRGSQVAANEYKINLATLMAHAVDAPELRAEAVPLIGTQAVPAIGTQAVPTAGTGVPVGVPIRDTGVSRMAAEAVPVAGTEQTSTLLTEHLNDANSLWLVALGLLQKRTPRHTWETWLRPLKAVSLTAGVLTLQLPSLAFDHVCSGKYGVTEALADAAALAGLSVERVETVCLEESLSESTNYDRPAPRPMLSPRSARRWQGSE
jgi:hypothetical protein